MQVHGPGPIPLTLNVNGERRSIDLEPRVSLLDALREYLDLTGSKKAATRGRAGRAPSGSTVVACWPASRSPWAARGAR